MRPNHSPHPPRTGEVHLPVPPPSSRFTIRAVAQVGNAVALFAILLILVNSALLFTPVSPPSPALAVIKPVRRVLLVVIDGLRADAVTRERMPIVHRIGEAGTSRISVVNALIPSTIAGVRALAEGVVVPPAEFVHDFRSRSAPGGGLIEAVNSAGGRVFAAGPHLWTDLYQQWLQGKLSVFGLARDDAVVLRAARAASSDPEWNLVIAHFCRPDVMAHLHGATSPEYEESIAWCDRAIGELIRTTGKDTLVVVTSDHGVTRAGGHAGAEPDVLNTPLAASDPRFAAGLPDTISQTQVPHLLASALGVRVSPPHSNSVPLHPARRTLLSLAGALLAGFALLTLFSTAAQVPPPPGAAFWLNVSVWTGLCLAWLSPWVACSLALAALLTLGRRLGAKWPGTFAAVMAAGLLLGMARLAWPWLSARSGAAAQPPLFMIATVCLAAFVIGYTAAQKIRPATITDLVWLGAGIIAAAPILAGFLGESVSLSTLDVRLAFRLIESPGGLAGAVLMGAIRPFIPILSLLAGVTFCWRLKREPAVHIAPLAAGAGAAIAGELVIAALTLATATSLSLSALALGLLLRECALIAVLFPLLAVMVVFLRRKVRCDNSPPRPARAFHPV